MSMIPDDVRRLGVGLASHAAWLAAEAAEQAASRAADAEWIALGKPKSSRKSPRATQVARVLAREAEQKAYWTCFEEIEARGLKPSANAWVKGFKGETQLEGEREAMARTADETDRRHQ